MARGVGKGGGGGPGATSWLSLTSSEISTSRFLAMLASVSPFRTVYGRTCGDRTSKQGCSQQLDGGGTVAGSVYNIHILIISSIPALKPAEISADAAQELNVMPSVHRC